MESWYGTSEMSRDIHIYIYIYIYAIIIIIVIIMLIYSFPCPCPPKLCKLPTVPIRSTKLPTNSLRHGHGYEFSSILV